MKAGGLRKLDAKVGLGCGYMANAGKYSGCGIRMQPYSKCGIVMRIWSMRTDAADIKRMRN